MKRFSRLGIFGLALLFVFGTQWNALAQEKDEKSAEKKTEKPAEGTAPKEESSTTEHTIKIGGQTIPYKAIAQTILLKDEKGEPEALLYSTPYIRTDVKDPSTRPLAFLYNGGPGSSSVWPHMGAFGPRRRRRTRPRTTEIPCWTKRTWSLSIPSERASATRWARRRTRISGVWIR